MAVTTSRGNKSHRNQSRNTASSFSDLEALLQRDSSPVQPVNPSTSESTTMNTQASSSAYQTSADSAEQNNEAAAAAARIAAGTPGSEMESVMAALFAQMLQDTAQQTKAATMEIAEHMKTAFEPLNEQLSKAALEHGDLAKQVTSLTDEVEKMKKDMAERKAAEASPKEASFWLRTANVVKDIGAYSGAAILVGVTGKVVYDTVFGKSDD